MNMIMAMIILIYHVTKCKSLLKTSQIDDSQVHTCERKAVNSSKYPILFHNSNNNHDSETDI